MNRYARFGVMIVLSTILMFGLMYLNTLQAEHIFFSETRAYMALIMGAAMAILMLLGMSGMYPNRSANSAIVVASLVVFAVSLWLVRTQSTVDDVSYMKAMIPHHSIAILTSSRAHLSDPRVRALADGIIKTQREEIAQMEALIGDIEQQQNVASE